jgi:hypothetical protein
MGLADAFQRVTRVVALGLPVSAHVQRRTGSFPLLVMISAVLLRGIALPTLLALSLRLRAWPLHALLRSRTL